jgi:hypothetical protein
LRSPENLGIPYEGVIFIDNPVADSINRHYLQVQALTPVSPVDTATKPFSAPANLLSFTKPAFIIFIVIMLLGIVGLLITHTRNLNKIILVMSVAFLTSLVPVSLSLMNQQASISSQAGALSIPKNVIVDQVTYSSFNVSWQTDNPTAGAVRLREKSQTSEFNQVISEDKKTNIYTHILNLKGLKPHTIYVFEILSEGEWYNQQGQPLTVTTAGP